MEGTFGVRDVLVVEMDGERESDSAGAFEILKSLQTSDCEFSKKRKVM